jgi:uncharacterized repeat protein (TIGR01451 family)
MRYSLLLFSALVISLFTYSQSSMPVIEWERTLGGSEDDKAYDFLIEPNGDIVAVGQSFSNDGDVTGHHGTVAKSDGWIVKLNSSGNILWQRSIGGSLNDDFVTIAATPDNGYLCVGKSESSDGNLHGNSGLYDGWMVKLTHDGDIAWSKNYGDSLYNSFPSVVVTADGSISVIAETIYGNYMEFLKQSVIKFDASGNILWQSFGLTGKSIVETNDHKLLTSSGLLFNEVSGDTTRFNGPAVSFLKKVNGRIYATRRNGNQSLVGYIDEGLGNNFFGQVWATDYRYDQGEGSFASAVFSPVSKGFAFLPSSNSYAVSGTELDYTRGGIFESGVFSMGSMPTLVLSNPDVDRLWAVNTLGNGDEFICVGEKWNISIWDANFHVIKYSIRNAITGNVFIDLNNNNIKDAGEPPFNNISINSSRNNINTISKTFNGTFTSYVDTGTYISSVMLREFPYYSVTPASASSIFTNYKNIDTVDFAIHKLADVRDYRVILTPYTAVRPMFPASYQIAYSNKGTDTLFNKILWFVKDAHLDIVQTTPLFNNTSGDTLFWNIDNVLPGEEAVINIQAIVGGSSPVSIGDTLTSYAFVDSTADNITTNNTDTLTQFVTGSFDPNDKSEEHGNYITQLEATAGNYLTYTIRFQNTGNDTAFNIIVKDTLDSRLQWSTLEAIGASHPYQVKLKDGRYIECLFKDIQLVDSFHNEPQSHGYITYRIKPKTNLVTGDEINNSASIYFDYNAPIKTNTQKTTVIKTTAIWTGAQNNAWENAANWNINVVPDSETMVVIPAGVPNYPVVNSSVVCFAIKVDKNASITINEGFNLEITGK